MLQAKRVVVYLGAGYVGARACVKSDAMPMQTFDARLHQGSTEELAKQIAVLAQSPDWITRARGSRVEMAVSSHWLGHACLPWSRGWLRTTQATDAARGFLMQAGHEPRPEDVVVLSDTQWGRPVLATLWSLALRDALDHLMRQWQPRGLRVVSASEWVWACTPSTKGSPPTRVLLESGPAETIALTVVRGTKTAVEDAVSRLAPSSADGYVEADRLGRRLGWLAQNGDRSPLEMQDWTGPATALTWLCQHQPSRQLAQLPLPRNRSAWLGSVFSPAVLASILLAGCSLGLAWQSIKLWQGSQELEHAAHKRTAPAEPPSVFKPSRELLRQIQAVDAAVGELNLPLAEVMRTLYPPTDIQVGVLGLELSTQGVSADGQRLKVHAESPSPQDMTRYVAFLASRAAFQGASLVRHEATADGIARSPTVFRYTVEVLWKP